MRTYVEIEIEEGAYDISCPEAKCDQEGLLSIKEIGTLVTPELTEKHRMFRLNRGNPIFELLKLLQKFL